MNQKPMRYILIVFAVSGLVCAFLRANSFISEYNRYIEVCSNGIAYVPKDTKFVKCNGIVRKVLRFEKAVILEVDPCQCPKCCDGDCYVIVNSDPSPESQSGPIQNSPSPADANFRERSNLDVYILWISC